MSRVFQALAGLAVLFAATVGNAESRTISAVYFRDALSFSVSYEAAHSGDAELKPELLSPEDHVLGEVERWKGVAEEKVCGNHERHSRCQSRKDQLSSLSSALVGDVEHKSENTVSAKCLYLCSGRNRLTDGSSTQD